MAQPSRKKTAVFEYIESTISQQNLSMVLFHGFGADADDLLGLQPYLKQNKVGRFIYPNGVIPANSMPYGRAWFPIDVSALEAAMMTGKYRDFSQEAPKELLILCQKIENSLINEVGINPKNCILAGFSQGAMLATHLMLNSEHDYKALCILSGSFLDRKNWEQKIAAKTTKPSIFLSHGDKDALLNPQDANDLFDCFLKHKYKVDCVPFTGGHEIPLEVITALSQFINRL